MNVALKDELRDVKDVKACVKGVKGCALRDELH